MTTVADFLIGVLGRIVSGLFTTYTIRLFDKILHKKNRHEF